MSSLFLIIKLFLIFLVIIKVQSGPLKRKKNSANNFELSVIHLNDFHARFEEINENSVTCKENDKKCIGGIARILTAVTSLLKERPNPIFLNAGDNFQGTLYYNLFKWNITQEFVNKIPTNVYTLGNHEFDDGIAGVVPYIKALNAPVVVANIDAREEPEMDGLFNKSVIVNVNGIRVGIIGALIQRTPKMAATEHLIFLPESASINEEADRLVAEKSVDTIIVLSHCGYDIDQVIAANATSKIGLIVGAHSHTFLYTGKNPPGPDLPAGDYPTVVEKSDGRKILVVQASAFSKYLGNITVYYDGNGDVVRWSGAPIYIENYTKDDNLEKQLQPWKREVDSYGLKVVGFTEVDLPSDNCRVEECLMGNVVTDTMVHSFSGSSSLIYPPIAIMNAGGVRTGLPAGEITYSDVLQVIPFENTIEYGTLKGKFLIDGLNQNGDDSLLHTSAGLRVTYDSNYVVYSVHIFCSGCDNPGFVQLNRDENYLVMYPSFFRSSGLYTSLYTNMSEINAGMQDSDAFINYLKDNGPIKDVIMGRLTVLSDGQISTPPSVDVTTEDISGNCTFTNSSSLLLLCSYFLLHVNS